MFGKFDSILTSFLFLVTSILSEWGSFYTSCFYHSTLLEEFIFRGILLNRFAAKWGVTTAIIFSSVLFGLAHMSIYALALGTGWIFVCLLYIKTKSMLVPIAFHAMNNLEALVAGTITGFAKSNMSIGMDDLWSGVSSIAFSIPILIYFLKWPNRSELSPYAANIESSHLSKLQSDRNRNLNLEDS
jgi:hypothetical protein